MELRLSRRTNLAMRALRELHQHREQMAGTALAERIETTSPFLPQVLSPMIKAGWIQSQTGPGGGYRLNVDLGALSLLDIVETVEGPTENGECVLREGACPGTESCPVHDAWLSARTELTDRLAAVSAEELLQRSRP